MKPHAQHTIQQHATRYECTCDHMCSRNVCRFCARDTPASSNASPCLPKCACSARYIFHTESSQNNAAYYPVRALHTVLLDVMTRRNSIVQDAEHINHKGASHSVAPTCVSSLASALGDSHSNTLSAIIRYNSTLV